MTMELTLRDIDTRDCSGQEWESELHLALRALFSDGSSETREFDRPDVEDIQSLLDDLKSAVDVAELEKLGPEHREAYKRWIDDATDCRCDGYWGCNTNPCIHYLHERNNWLESRITDHVIVDWHWLPIGDSGSGVVGFADTICNEDPGLAGGIANHGVF
jgi:hypothetical protein